MVLMERFIILCSSECLLAKLWNGGMEEWRNGGMAEWRNGGMAEWRNGGMAEWRYGGMAEWRYGGMAGCRNGGMAGMAEREEELQNGRKWIKNDTYVLFTVHSQRQRH